MSCDYDAFHWFFLISNNSLLYFLYDTHTNCYLPRQWNIISCTCTRRNYTCIEGGLLMIIVIFNNIFNFSYSSLSYEWLQRPWPSPIPLKPLGLSNKKHYCYRLYVCMATWPVTRRRPCGEHRISVIELPTRRIAIFCQWFLIVVESHIVIDVEKTCNRFSLLVITMQAKEVSVLLRIIERYIINFVLQRYRIYECLPKFSV